MSNPESQNQTYEAEEVQAERSDWLGRQRGSATGNQSKTVYHIGESSTKARTDNVAERLCYWPVYIVLETSAGNETV